MCPIGCYFIDVITSPVMMSGSTSVSIRYLENDKNRLYILEALIIKEEDPEINKQDTGRSRTLKLYGISPCPRTQTVT